MIFGFSEVKARIITLLNQWARVMKPKPIWLKLMAQETAKHAVIVGKYTVASHVGRK